jgi:hypothetical protein
MRANRKALKETRKNRPLECLGIPRIQSRTSGQNPNFTKNQKNSKNKTLIKTVLKTISLNIKLKTLSCSALLYFTTL